MTDFLTDSNGHGPTSRQHISPRAALTATPRRLFRTLRDRLGVLASMSRGASREYGIALDRWEASRAEARTRDTLPAELREWEDSSRIDTARKAYPSDVGHPRHRGDRSQAHAGLRSVAVETDLDLLSRCSSGQRPALRLLV